MWDIIGTKIFWITFIITPVLLTLITFIGYLFCKLFPQKFKSDAGFYLSPAIGLSVLVILSSMIGRVVPMGDLGVFIFSVATIIILALLFWQNLYEIFKHSLVVSIFGIICGISLLGPLFSYGGVNPHNDTFTYLAHSNWLQDNSFGQIISSENITPLTTQINLYQIGGLRMGGSFFLALAQSLFRLNSSFEIYPAVIIIMITACCLSIGFILVQISNGIKRNTILALLSLPALSMGGLIFGANLGFLPQTMGLTLGVSFLIMVGFSFSLIIERKNNLILILKLAFLSSLLFSGATFAYSEIIPFLLLAVFMSGLFVIVRFFIWKELLIFGSIFFCFSIALLNLEVVRVFKALSIQMGAVVGTPVNWMIVGYISHALGVHGGAWDMLQWSNIENIHSVSFIFGILYTILLIGIIFISRRSIWKYIENGILLPNFMILIIFSFFFLYFRYFVPSPFSIGIGQSWSQFKISDWAGPFLMVILLFSFVTFKVYSNNFFNISIVVLFLFCFVGTIFTSINRIKPLMDDYGKINNLDKFYIDFRERVNASCPYGRPIYLNFYEADSKFRQMAILYLYDRKIKSDWTSDGYIYGHLPIGKQKQDPSAGDCIIESYGKNDLLDSNKKNKIGKFQIGILQNNTRVRIVNVLGAYESENDAENNWNWVKNQVSFNLQARSSSDETMQTELFFEYIARGSRTLSLDVIMDNGEKINFILQCKESEEYIFNKIINVNPFRITEIKIKSDGEAIRLNKDDFRLASFMIRNMKVKQYNNR